MGPPPKPSGDSRGFGGESRSSEMIELSPQAEANDMELATTKELGILGPADRHSEAPEGPWESAPEKTRKSSHIPLDNPCRSIYNTSRVQRQQVPVPGVSPAESAFKGNTFDCTVLLSFSGRFFAARINFWR